MRPLHEILAPVLVLLTGVAATGDIVTIDADRDNSIYDEADDLSNGAGDHFFAGRTNGDDLRRGLVRFNVAAAVPAGSTINSVSLQLRMSRTQSGDMTVSIHRLLADWGEGLSDAPDQEGEGAAATDGDATWKYTFYDTGDPSSAPQWAGMGGDFVGAASGSLTIGGNGFYTWSTTAQMVADVQSWLDTPGDNYGWIVIGDESQTQTAKRFDSRDISQTSRRPKLTIDYTAVVTEGACCESAVCTLVDEADCLSAGGVFQGAGTVCDPNPCLTGGCCFGDGSCLELTGTDCGIQGGAYEGDGTDCTPNPCPQPTGACCAADASCTVETEPDCLAAGGTYHGAGSTCEPCMCPYVVTKYVDALPVPPVMSPISGTPGGVAAYDIAMSEFMQQLHSEMPPTTVWGYNGSYPSATIEAGRDKQVTVDWINALPATHHLPVDTCPHGADDDSSRTVVHLHGGHVPADVDGYPEDAYLPGNSLVYAYPNNQLPATLWYHDHALGITRLNVYMGMAGFYLLRDQFEIDLDLPEGEFEIPMVIQDRSFNPDGSWCYPAQWEDHWYGNMILVNGKVWPRLAVKRATYRFRMLNGSNTRTYTLSLSNGAMFHQIGTDGGLVEHPVTLSEITLGPAERADVMLDFSAYSEDTEIILLNSEPPHGGHGAVLPEIMKFVVTNDTGPVLAVPDPLRPLESLDPAHAVRERFFVLRKQNEPCAGFRWLINDLLWDDITEDPRLGHTEIWSFVNASGMMHPMHMHLVMFQVLNRQDYMLQGEDVIPVGDPIPPEPGEVGWKDTVRATPQQITRVITRFEDYTGLFPYHCHILEHEDHEMMRQFMARPACPWDLDYDDLVGINDFLDLLAAWGSCPLPCPPACVGDTNGDCQVGINDFLELLANWGPCP